MTSFTAWYSQYYKRAAKRYAEFIKHIPEPEVPASEESREFISDWLLVDNLKTTDAAISRNLIFGLILICIAKVGREFRRTPLTIRVGDCEIISTIYRPDYDITFEEVSVSSEPSKTLVGLIRLFKTTNTAVIHYADSTCVVIPEEALIKRCPNFQNLLRAAIMVDVFVAFSDSQKMGNIDDINPCYFPMDYTSGVEEFAKQITKINTRGF